MKKLFSLLVLSSLLSIAHCQLKMNSSGNFGIGKSASSYKFDIYGNTRIYNPSVSSLVINYMGGWYGPSIEPTGNNVCNLGQSNHGFRYLYVQTVTYTSDERLKENIKPLKNSLDLVLRLNAVKYDLKKEYYNSSLNLDKAEDINKIEDSRKNLLGFIAQDIKEIIPEIVTYDDLTDIYGIDYIRMVPILVQAIQEQNAQIRQLEEKILSAIPTSVETSIDLCSEAMLGKNKPNPFNENTTIEFFLPSTVQKAVLRVYDLQGKQVKAINISSREQGSATIYASELQPGMYHYTLIADGKVIGIEKMILTD